MDMSALAADPSLQYGTVKFPITRQVLDFLIVNVVLGVVVVTVCVLRCVSRRIHGAGIGIDDYLCFVSALLGIGCLVISGLMSTIGSGHPVQEVMMNLATQLLLTFALQPFYIFSLMFSKLSVCSFYLRIFPNNAMKVGTKITIVVVILWALSHYLIGVFICSPVRAQYDLLAAATGKCLDQIPLFQSLIVMNIVTDLIIMALPLRTIWNLKMRKSDKLGLCGSFLVGFALVILGVFRIVYVSVVDIRGDLTGTMPISIFLTVLDTQLAIVCISIPMLRPLWMRMRGIRSNSNQAAYGTDGSGPSGKASRLHTNEKRSKNDPHGDVELTVWDGADAGRRADVDACDAPSIQSESSESNLKEKDMHRIRVEKQYTVAHES